MKKHRIEIDPMAEEDMQACFDYIALQLKNPLAALDMLDEIERKYNLLEDNPLIGAEHITEAGRLYRYVLVKRYKMFYSVNNGVVLICRFLYSPSNFSRRLDQEP